MTEPVYNYVRGQGWIVQYPTIITMLDGLTAYLEYRRPEIGERYTWNWKGAWGHKEWNDWLGRQQKYYLTKFTEEDNIPEGAEPVVIVIL